MILRVGVLALLGFIVAASLLSLWLGARGVYRPIRRVPGVDVIREAVGRAAEMGRPILFSTGSGSGGLNSDSAPYHLAGVNLLGYVAGLSASAGTRLSFASAYPELIPVAQETIRDAYAASGNAEAYRGDAVRYYGRGWGYASACIGQMEEERPAAAFWLGIFWSEALLLSETGANIGAYQVAGQPDSVNLPFQVASCDYTLIGEELFVAGAVVSGDGALMGSVAAAEAAKVLVAALIIVGAAAATLGLGSLTELLKAGGA